MKNPTQSTNRLMKWADTSLKTNYKRPVNTSKNVQYHHLSCEIQIPRLDMATAVVISQQL